METSIGHIAIDKGNFKKEWDAAPKGRYNILQLDVYKDGVKINSTSRDGVTEGTLTKDLLFSRLRDYLEAFSWTTVTLGGYRYNG